MESLLKKIKSGPFLPPMGSRVMLAISGGADSIAMLLLLNQLKHEMGWWLAVAHVDHGLRAQSADDARFVADLAAELDLPFYRQRVRIEQKKLSPEEAARLARRGALLNMAAQQQAQYIALAHHADDQAETVLMRLINGTGPSGLAGMRVFSSPWWRPLLALGGRELRGFLLQQNQPWCEDHTNAQTGFTRNRIRHELLPLLLKKFNPQVIAAVNRLAEICAEEETFWRKWAQEQSCLEQDGADWLLKLKPEWGLAEKRRFLRFALAEIYGQGQHVLAVHIEQLLALLSNSQTGKQLPLPGNWLAWREGQWLAITKDIPFVWQDLVLHGPASFYWQNTWYGMKTCEYDQEINARGEIAWLPMAQISWPVVLRQPQPGERFKALRGAGSRKISRLLQDMGIARRKRARVLVLADQLGPWWLAPVVLHQRVAQGNKPWLKIFPVKAHEHR